MANIKGKNWRLCYTNRKWLIHCSLTQYINTCIDLSCYEPTDEYNSKQWEYKAGYNCYQDAGKYVKEVQKQIFWLFNKKLYLLLKAVTILAIYFAIIQDDS